MSTRVRNNLIKFIPFNLRKYIFRLNLYIKSPKLFFLSNTKFTTNSNPILLLSFPRSGSSWVGSVMGMGQDIRYLREPVTTNYILTKGKNKSTSNIKRISVFDQESCDNWSEYQQYIDDSLLAKPNFPNAVIPYPRQWKSPKQDKSLLIKEVNPLAINYYLSNKVKLIYLVRHPFSVAKSYQALNWRANDLFTKKLNSESLSQISTLAPNIRKEDAWLQMGYLQGWIEASVKDHMAITSNAVSIVRYEDICHSPENQFKALFNFANIDYSNDIIKKIQSSRSRKDDVSVGDFSLTRNSAKLAQIKIKAEEHEVYFKVMKAYHQAFNDFKKSKTLNKSSSQNISTSYEKNSPLVKLYNS